MLLFPNISKSLVLQTIKNKILTRNIVTTSCSLIKDIKVSEGTNSLIIEGVNLPSPRTNQLLKEVCQPKFCPECTLGLDIKHTDVLILSQYVRSDGCMLPRRITGLCKRQQRRISALVTMAHKAGLMPNLGSKFSKKDPKKRFEWKKFNKYFDESTIRC